MIGKLNTTKIIKEYEGKNTPTAQTIVDNDKNIIKVNVDETFIDSKIKIDEIKVNGVKQEPINKSIDIQVPEMTSESIKQKYESNPDTNAFTDIDKEKVDKLVIDGDGTNYLSDDGSYKEISIPQGSEGPQGPKGDDGAGFYLTSDKFIDGSPMTLLFELDNFNNTNLKQAKYFVSTNEDSLGFVKEATSYSIQGEVVQFALAGPVITNFRGPKGESENGGGSSGDVFAYGLYYIEDELPYFYVDVSLEMISRLDLNKEQFLGVLSGIDLDNPLVTTSLVLYGESFGTPNAHLTNITYSDGDDIIQLNFEFGKIVLEEDKVYVERSMGEFPMPMSEANLKFVKKTI